MATKKAKDRLEELRKKGMGVDEDGVYRKAAPTNEELAIKRLNALRSKVQARTETPATSVLQKEETNAKPTKYTYQPAVKEQQKLSALLEEAQAKLDNMNKTGAKPMALTAQQARVDALQRKLESTTDVVKSGEKQDLSFYDRLMYTIGGGAKETGAEFANVGGTFLDTMAHLDDAAFLSQYKEQYNAAQNSYDYWSGVAASATTEEDKAKAEDLAARAKARMDSIAALRNKSGKEVENAAQSVYKTADRISDSAQEDILAAKEGLGAIGQTAVDLGVVGTQFAGDAAAAIATGGQSLIPMAIRSFGAGTQKARRAGGTFSQQIGYGAASAALSVGTEKLFSLATPLSKAFGGGVADDAIKKLSGKLSSSVAGRTVLNALGEGSEEMIESIVDPLLQKIYDSEAGYNSDTLSDVLYSGLLGALFGGALGSIGEVSDAYSAKEIYSGSEQELVDEALALNENNRTAKNANKRLSQGKSLSGTTLNNLVQQNEAAILRNGEQVEAEETEADKVRKLIATLTGDGVTEDAIASAAEQFWGYTVSEEELEARRKREAEAKLRERTATPVVSDYSEEEAQYLVQEGAKEFGNASSSVVNSYMRGQDPQLYMAQARLAFDYGKTMSEEKGLSYALKSPALKSLDETQIRSLFNAGRMQAKSIPVSAVKGTGKAVLADGIDYSTLSSSQKAQVNALSAFAKASGYTIELFESKAGADGRYTAEQGSFNTKTGVIRIDINAGRNKVTDLTNYSMVRVASHEITHSFKKNAPTEYAALRDYVTGILADKGKFEDLVDTKMGDLGLDRESAVDEVVADGCEMMLRDTRFAEKLATENRTLFEKIRDAIRKFVKKIRDAFEGVEISHEEAMLLKDAENLQKLWDAALAKSVENVAAAEEIGFDIDTATESIAASLHSERTWTESEYVQQRMVDEFVAEYKGKNGDVQYSKRDTDYIAAVKSGDMKTAQKMVDEAAKAAGYNIQAYHGTNAQFFTFDKGRVGKGQDVYGSGFYFADNEEAAENYGKRIIPAYLRLENPYRIIVKPSGGGLRNIRLTQRQVYEILKRHPKIRAEDGPLGDFFEEFWETGAKDWMIRSLARQYDDLQTIEGDLFRDYPNELHEAVRDVTGHDGIEVHFQNDETGFSPEDGGTFYVAWFDNQMKSSETVVQDDAGKVIPLSERFNPKNNDIRYSKRTFSKKDYAKVRGALVEMYRGVDEADIPPVDYVSAAEYNKVNEAYVYTVKNNGYLDFEIVSKKRVESRFEGWVEKEKRHGENGARTGENDVRQGFVSRRYESGDRTPAHGERVRGNAQGDSADGNAGQADGVGAGDERNGVNYSFRTGYIPTDRSILSDYVPKATDSDTIKRHIAEYQKNVEELRSLEQTLREQREQMQSLTGDGSKAQRAKLRDEIVKTQNRIQIANDQLRRKESWMGVRTVLKREKDALVKKARAEEREKLTKYREQRWDTENRRKLRERITYRVKTLDKMLREPTDDKHIPEELRKAVFDFCEVFQDEVGVFSQKQLDRLNVAYAFLAEEHEGVNESYLYDEDIKEMISRLGVLMDGKRLSELSVEALQFVRNIADHMYFIVRDENEVFLNGRKVKMQTIATKAIEEAKESEKKGGLTIGRDGDAFLKFLTSGNLKPVYLFERTGNQLRDLFNGLLAGQSEYGRREQKAKAFVEQVKKDTGYSEWSSSEETLKMTNGAGQQIELTVQQAMSLLATYEREMRQGLFHVTKGGFVYENGLTGDVTVKGVKIPVVKRKVEAEAHPMSAEDMDKVRSWLGEVDPRVLDYMERMVEYLSTTMAAYGNETSMQLHGYKKFSEGYYFPIRSSDDYLNKDPGKGGFDENRWKNKGFTKALTKSANNPFVLIDFDKVWSNHVSQMLMYSTMAVPQESFVRVLNFKTPVDPTGLSNSESMRSVIKQYYGSNVADYIDTLLRDVNGGVTTDSRESALNRFVSLYKKNAVLGSMSVTVQQISSVARAMAIIDPKHFTKGKPFADFQEALEHSGVAVIKQMGGFDTTTGRGGAEWLMEEVPGGKFRDAKSFSEGLKMFAEKGKALTQFGEKDTGYRDRWLGALPARMDELGFGMIWNAAKNEVSDGGEYEDGTEAFYEAVTKRFEEVIEKTQVYDSVLSRSENMRSKGNLMKAATSFMAEPTVTANMMMDSVWKLRRNKDEDSRKYLGRVIASLLLSVIANNFLKSFATAPRDKDKDQTIVEKWFEDFVGGTVNDLIVTNYIPYLREVTSVVMGYGVEATWFAPAEDLINATVNWIRDGEFSWGATKDIVNAVSALKGLPTKNLLRIPESIINLFANTASIKEWSWRGMENAALEGILGGLFMPGVDDAIEKAYKADKNGNEAKRKKALDEIVGLYEDKVKQFRLEGKEDAAKKAKSSLKSSITAELKPLYQAAMTQAEKNRIKSLALRVYVGGEQLYNGYDFERYWGEE